MNTSSQPLLAAAALLLSLVATACADNSRTLAEPDPVTTVAPATTLAAPASTGAGAAVVTTSAGSVTAATAVVGPDTVAGLRLGATKAEVLAVLGNPTSTEQSSDINGTKYESLTWRVSGNRGLVLAFRPYSRFAPGLTDWVATAAGPRTAAGVQVGDAATKVIAAYGALQPFCCGTKVASVETGPGRMIVVVDDAPQKVFTITGGDPAAWSRSIAD